MAESGSGTDLLGVAEAADILGIDKRTIHRKVARGELSPASKLPGLRGAFVFNRADIEALRSAS